MKSLDRWLKHIEAGRFEAVWAELPARYGYEAVRVFDVHGGTAELAYALGGEGEKLESLAMLAQPWQGVIGQAFANRDILQVSDYAAHPSALPERKEHVRSLLAVPLQQAGEDLGVIALLTHSRSHPGLSEEQLTELRILRGILSAQTAARRARAQLERQRGLVTFMDAVHRINRLDELITMLFRRLAEDIGADAVGINFVEGNSLRLVYGLGSETGTEPSIVGEAIVPFEKETLTYQVLSSGEPLLVGDITDPNAKRRYPSRIIVAEPDEDDGGDDEFELRSYLGVPFQSRSTRGVISLQSGKPWRYGVEDVAHMVALAEVLGYAIEHLRWRGLERFARRLGQLHQWRTTDEREVFTQMLLATSEVWPQLGAAFYLREDEATFRRVATTGDQTRAPERIESVELHFDQPLVFTSYHKLPDALRPLWSSEQVRGALLLPFGEGFVWLESASGFTDWDLRMARSMLHELRPYAERMGLHTRLAREAAMDPLTGVYNRRRLEQRLARMVSLASRHGQEFSVAVVDMANFGSVNNRYGHLVGDRVLARVAKILKQSLREEDEVYRLGGDEFVIVLPQSGRGAGLRAARRAADALARDPELQHYGVHANFGIAVYREGDAPEDLLERADREMYAAKKRGLVVLEEPSGE